MVAGRSRKKDRWPFRSCPSASIAIVDGAAKAFPLGTWGGETALQIGSRPQAGFAFPKSVPEMKFSKLRILMGKRESLE